MSKARLLIVDDQVQLLDAIVEYLERCGYEVVGVLDGDTALKMLCDEGPYDVLISDINMSGMDGLELVRRARARSVKTTALLISAYSESDDKVAGYEAGADDYLVKPFTVRELEYRIEALLQRETAPDRQKGDHLLKNR